MSKKSNKGKALPDLRKCRDTVTVKCPEEINELDDCCTLLKTGELALFYEKMHENDYYWLFFMADQDEVMVCHLEGFANACQDWNGKRADYLAVSTHRKMCYILVIELRQEISEVKQLKDKQNQVEQSMNKVLELLKDKIATSEHLPPICAFPTYFYKIFGFIVPATRSFNKDEKIKLVTLKDGSLTTITSLPYTKIDQSHISWSLLMAAIDNNESPLPNPT